jgi:hypothetical protein
VSKKHSLNEVQEVHVSDGSVLDFYFAKGQEALYNGSLTETEEIHIPDYVMLDFGFPKSTHASGKLPA